MSRDTAGTGAETNHRASIEIHENIAFERVEWVVQRIGFAALGLLLLAALLGLFGDGLLSSRRVSSGDGQAAVEYERFVRHGTSWYLRLESRAPGVATIVIGRSLLENQAIEHVFPEPTASRSSPDGTVLTFGSPIERLDIRLHPVASGSLDYVVSVGDRRFTLHQFMYY